VLRNPKRVCTRLESSYCFSACRTETNGSFKAQQRLDARTKLFKSRNSCRSQTAPIVTKKGGSNNESNCFLERHIHHHVHYHHIAVTDQADASKVFDKSGMLCKLKSEGKSDDGHNEDATNITVLHVKKGPAGSSPSLGMSISEEQRKMLEFETEDFVCKNLCSHNVNQVRMLS
jgi:hypothetical protein